MSKSFRLDESSSSSSLLPPTPVTAPPRPFLTTSQVDEFLETLDTPLQDRNVLIPLTKYAFVHGRLQPSTTTKGEEIVRVAQQQKQKQQQCPSLTLMPPSLEDTLEMTLSQAKDWLQQYSSKQYKPKSILSKTNQSQASALPSLFSSPSSSSSSTSKPHPRSSSSPTFVDIQEEYDDEGNPLSANVIDINRQLEAFLKLDEAESKENNWMDLVLEGGGQESSTLEEVEPPIKSSLTDLEYQQLSQRLQELARLEEEYEQQDQSDTRPIRPSKGGHVTSKGGWNKGFLNVTKQPTPKAKPTPKPKAKPTLSPSLPKPSPAAVRIDTSQNQVQEIPRIGTQKLPPKKTPPSSKPLQESAFSGVIQERSTSVVERVPVPVKKTSRFATSRQQKELPDQELQNKPKRMSRFSQERQGF